MEMTKQDIIAAIIGYGEVDCQQAQLFTNIGYMRWTGNQNLEEWKFNRSVLSILPDEELMTLLESVRRVV